MFSGVETFHECFHGHMNLSDDDMYSLPAHWLTVSCLDTV